MRLDLGSESITIIYGDQTTVRVLNMNALCNSNRFVDAENDRPMMFNQKLDYVRSIAHFCPCFNAGWDGCDGKHHWLLCPIECCSICQEMGHMDVVCHKQVRLMQRP